MQVRVNRRYTLSEGRSFITFAKLTPLMVTADKNVVAHLYTTTDDTEVGDEYSTHLLGLCTPSTGGSDSFCCGVIKAAEGIYAEILENGSGSTADAAILTVSYVTAEDFVDAYPDVAQWRNRHWQKADGRAGTEFASTYYKRIDDDNDSMADGGDGSNSGGDTLEASSTVFVTDEILSNLTTGVRN